MIVLISTFNGENYTSPQIEYHDTYGDALWRAKGYIGTEEELHRTPYWQLRMREGVSEKITVVGENPKEEKIKTSLVFRYEDDDDGLDNSGAVFILDYVPQPFTYVVINSLVNEIKIVCRDEDILSELQEVIMDETDLSLSIEANTQIDFSGHIDNDYKLITSGYCVIKRIKDNHYTPKS